MRSAYRQRLLVLALAALSLALAPAAAQAIPSSVPDQSAFVTDGAVRAIAPGPGGTTYIGGDFTQLRAQTGGFASVGTTDGLRSGPFPEISGSVAASAPDGAGGIYIGGQIFSVGGVPRENIAHILADGTVDPNFDPQAKGGFVNAIAVSGNDVYVGGSFGNIGGRDRSGIAKLSAASGNAFSAWDPNAKDGGDNGAVRHIAVSGSQVFVGGSFTDIGGLARDRLAKLSADTGNAFSAWAPNPDDFVGSLAVSGAEVFVGGAFNNVGGRVRDGIAKLSADTGNAFSGFDPSNTNGGVNAIAVSADGTEVFVGGQFTQIGGLARSRLAKLSADTGNAFSGWDPNVTTPPGEGGVNAVAVSGDEVYVGGRFTHVGGVARNHMAKLSAVSGNPFSAFDPNPSGAVGPTVNTVSLVGPRVTFGGSFDTINSVARKGIAALDAGGRPTAWDPNAIGGTVHSLEVSGDGTQVFAGGTFTNIGGLDRNRIAKLSGASGNAFSAWNPNATGGLITRVKALELLGDELFVGGDFTNIGGLDRNHIAKLSAVSGNAFSAWNPNVARPGGDPPLVNAIVAGPSTGFAEDGTAIFVGGGFTNIGGRDRDNIAKLSPASGNAFSAWNPSADNAVAALAVDTTELYVGGLFENIGGRQRSRIAKLSNAHGGAFSAWNASANDNVLALATGSQGRFAVSRVPYAGGAFTQIGGLTRNRLAGLSASSGNAFSAFDPDVRDGLVLALAHSGSKLHVAGTFTRVNFDSFGGRPRQGYAQFSER